MFFIIIGLQAALIYFHCFSPFERESNWLAVVRGAKPGPRFWAVALLDLCTALLMALLARSVWPAAPTLSPLEQLARIVGAGVPLGGTGVGLAALFTIVHHFVNDAVAHFPNPGAMARRLAAALGAGPSSPAGCCSCVPIYPPAMIPRRRSGG